MKNALNGNKLSVSACRNTLCTKLMPCMAFKPRKPLAKYAFNSIYNNWMPAVNITLKNQPSLKSKEALKFVKTLLELITPPLPKSRFTKKLSSEN